MPGHEMLGEAMGTAARLGIIGLSKPFRETLEKAARTAKTKLPVLIYGETGTGKELVAGLIHEMGPTSSAPRFSFNCAEIKNEMAESQLFGHIKGSFTGALTTQVGFFESAGNGSIFLDEIGEMELPTQAKLLRVLQEKTFRKLGSSRTQTTNARILFATNRDLGRSIREGTFRKDLFYRINVLTVHLPPLRDRANDRLLLVNHFLQQSVKEFGKQEVTLSEDDKQFALEYEWPGNVRELENLIMHAVIMADPNANSLELRRRWKEISGQGHMTIPEKHPSFQVDPDAPITHCEKKVQAEADGPGASEDVAPAPTFPHKGLKERERQYLFDILKQSKFEPVRAAEMAGMNYHTFRYRLTKHDLWSEERRAEFLANSSQAIPEEHAPADPSATFEEARREYFLDAFEESGRDVSRTSQMMGLKYSTVRRQLKRYGLC